MPRFSTLLRPSRFSCNGFINFSPPLASYMLRPSRPWFYLLNNICWRVNNASINYIIFLVVEYSGKNVRPQERPVLCLYFLCCNNKQPTSFFITFATFLRGIEILRSVCAWHRSEYKMGMIWISTISQSVFGNFTVGRPTTVCYYYGQIVLRKPGNTLQGYWSQQTLIFIDSVKTLYGKETPVKFLSSSPNFYVESLAVTILKWTVQQSLTSWNPLWSLGVREGSDNVRKAVGWLQFVFVSY
jgi:hypothetical protein